MCVDGGEEREASVDVRDDVCEDSERVCDDGDVACDEYADDGDVRDDVSRDDTGGKMGSSWNERSDAKRSSNVR